MNVKELIALLEKLPQNLPIRLVNSENDEENIWAFDVEVSPSGASGYESSGEIRIIGGE